MSDEPPAKLCLNLDCTRKNPVKGNWCTAKECKKMRAGVRCGAPTVIPEAPSEYQMMICSANPYNQRLTTLSTYHQLIPMSMSHHSYAVGGRGGVMPYKPVFLPLQTLSALGAVVALRSVFLAQKGYLSSSWSLVHGHLTVPTLYHPLVAPRIVT